MTDGKRPRREYDDRAHRVRRLIDGLISVGVIPRVIELDGLHVEVAEYRPPVQALASAGVPRVLEPGLLASADVRAHESSVRSYRAQAREDLRRRIREGASE